MKIKATDLAELAGVGIMTVRRAEDWDGSGRISANTATAIVRALEAAGVIFIAADAEGPGVRLAKP